MTTDWWDQPRNPGAEMTKGKLSRCQCLGDGKEKKKGEGRRGKGREGGREGAIPVGWAVLCFSLPWAFVMVVWVGFVILHHYWKKAFCRNCLKLQGFLGESSKINEAKLPHLMPRTSLLLRSVGQNKYLPAQHRTQKTADSCINLFLKEQGNLTVAERMASPLTPQPHHLLRTFAVTQMLLLGVTKPPSQAQSPHPKLKPPCIVTFQTLCNGHVPDFPL